MNEMDTLLEDHETFHSEFQILNFILGELDNDWSRYQQCLKELKSRKATLQSLKDDIRLAEIDFKAHKKKSPWYGMDRRERHRIRLNQLARSLKTMRTTAADIEREMRIFFKVAWRLKTEKFKDLTREQKRDLESQKWFEKAKTLAAVDIHTMGRLTPVTVNFIRQLPLKMRLEIIELCHPDNIKSLVSWAILNGTDRNLIENRKEHL